MQECADRQKFNCLQVRPDSLDCIRELVRGSGAALTALAEPAQYIVGEQNANDVKVTTADVAWIDLTTEELPF